MVNNNEEQNNSRAILVGISIKNSNNNNVEILSVYDSVDELGELADACNLEVCGTVIQNKDAYDPAYLLGKGKLEEIKDMIGNLNVDIVIFDDELTGSQIRNISEFLGINVIDRITLVLEIFAKRAISNEGKLQVELAQQKYRSSRLTGIGKSLSQQAGGIGSKGPGEKKLETDKRKIRKRINEIEEKLKEIERHREVKRKSRLKKHLPIIALLGYTNSGKSTLFNEMIKTHIDYQKEKEVEAKNMLFASLEVNLRKATLPSNTDILVTDTVGFISSIPHYLVDAFKATLEELEYADLLLHVIDISNKNYEKQIRTTNKILEDLKLKNKKVIYVINKIDKVDNEDIYIPYSPSIKISALKKINLNKLYLKIDEIINYNLEEHEFLIPFDKGNIVNFLHERYNFNEDYREDGIYIKINIRKEDFDKLKKYSV